MNDTYQPVVMGASSHDSRARVVASTYPSFAAAWVSTIARWRLQTNPMAGVAETRWFAQNQAALASYEGLWIGIKGHGVVASGPSLDDVHSQLTANNISDALIVLVPSDIRRPRLLIA